MQIKLEASKKKCSIKIKLGINEIELRNNRENQQNQKLILAKNQQN